MATSPLFTAWRESQPTDCSPAGSRESVTLPPSRCSSHSSDAPSGGYGSAICQAKANWKLSQDGHVAGLRRQRLRVDVVHAADGNLDLAQIAARHLRQLFVKLRISRSEAR